MPKDGRSDSTRLDVRALANANAGVAGTIERADLRRLNDSLLQTPGDLLLPPVSWRAAGELRRPAGAQPETWLHLQADADVMLECQRCLQPMAHHLGVDRWFRFAADEDEAARLDEDIDEDVLVFSPRFDAAALVEDELILALPLVPVHGACLEPLVGVAQDAGHEAGTSQPTQKPFAVLAGLRALRGDDGASD